MDFKKYIREVPNFPINGILFKDISPLLEEPDIFSNAISQLGQLTNLPDLWVGIESRGFIFASALSIKFGGGVKLIRKKGKLPDGNLKSISYSLEYGEDELEMEFNKHNKTAVIVDDVLASGGTLNAAINLCRECNLNVIDKVVLIDLGFSKISDNVKSLIRYE